jgi:hypothetical protein
MNNIAPEPEPAPQQAPIPDDIRTLPILTASESGKHGLSRLQLNVLREADANRPNAHAIINLEKVYVGETIPGTSAKLIEVKKHGIAIEVTPSGSRYYIPH